MTVDVLAIGAHPDDADLGLGGTLLKLAAQGHATAILDLTRGEMGSRGTPEERAAEAAEAAKRLDLTTREQAGLPDGGLVNTPEQRLPIVRHIRALRPRILLAPLTPDRHPDHEAAHALAKDAGFFAGVSGIDTGQPPYRAEAVYYYHSYHEPAETPTFISDITPYFDQKQEALRAFKSQFHNPQYEAPETYVASEAFWNNIKIRAEYWGARIGVQYGEPIHAQVPIALDISHELR